MNKARSARLALAISRPATENGIGEGDRGENYDEEKGSMGSGEAMRKPVSTYT
jgi:hypothetical protein